MNYIKHLSGFFDKVSIDNRLNPTHISLYVSLFQFWNACRFHNPISISRNEVMKVSKICSKATYHKCIRELNEYGYLRYMPSYNPFKGSLVYLFDFRTGTELVVNKKRTKIETSTEQALNRYRTKIETSTEQALVPYINNTNINKHKTKLNKREEHSRSNKKSTSLNFSKVEKGEDKSEKKLKRKKVAAKKEKENFIIPELSEVKKYFEDQKSEPIVAEKFFNHFQSNGWLVGGRSKMKDWQAASRNWILNEKKYLANQTNTKRTNLNVTKGKNYNEPL